MKEVLTIELCDVCDFLKGDPDSARISVKQCAACDKHYCNNPAHTPVLTWSMFSLTRTSGKYQRFVCSDCMTAFTNSRFELPALGNAHESGYTPAVRAADFFTGYREIAEREATNKVIELLRGFITDNNSNIKLEVSEKELKERFEKELADIKLKKKF